MTRTTEKADGEVYALIAKPDKSPIFIVGCRGSAERHHQKELASALRGQKKTGDIDRLRLDWIAEQIASGVEVELISLQSGISRSDLDFFLAYWSNQFPELKHYPENANAPDTITDTGRKVMGLDQEG